MFFRKNEPVSDKQINADSFIKEDYGEESSPVGDDSIKRRINKHPKPFFTLSGGMDSSTILSSAVKLLGKKLPAITTIYDDETYDESFDIKPMLKKNVGEWHKIKISSKNIDSKIIEANQAHDEPMPTATWLSDFFLKKKVNKLGYKVCFSGLGGDQLNAGEHDYFHYFFDPIYILFPFAGFPWTR